jgi:hypothetical protein
LENLQKPAFYVGINGIHYDGNGVTHYRFQPLHCSGNHCVKYLPQFAGKTDVGTITAHGLPHPGNTISTLGLFGDHQ